MKPFLLLALLFCPLWASAQLPDAPQSPLPSTKVLDWKFAAAHAGYLGAMLWDQHETLQGEARGCALESGNPTPFYATRADLMRRNLPYFAGIFAADFLMRRYRMKFWFVAPAVAAGKHLYGGAEWLGCR